MMAMSVATLEAITQIPDLRLLSSVIVTLQSQEVRPRNERHLPVKAEASSGAVMMTVRDTVIIIAKKVKNFFMI